MTGAQSTGASEGESNRGWTKSHPSTTSLAQAGQLQDLLLLLGHAGGEGKKQEEVQEDKQE